MRTNAILFSTLAIGLVLGAGDVAAGPKGDTGSFHMSFSVGKGRLGVSVLGISPELRAHLGAPVERGVLVNTEAPISPAAKAGVRVGDVIVAVDGAAADSALDITDAMSDRKKGDTVAIEVIRDRKPVALRATLDDDPAPATRSFRDLGGQLDLKGLFGQDRDDLERRLEALEKRLDRLDRK